MTSVVGTVQLVRTAKSNVAKLDDRGCRETPTENQKPFTTKDRKEHKRWLRKHSPGTQISNRTNTNKELQRFSGLRKVKAGSELLLHDAGWTAADARGMECRAQ